MKYLKPYKIFESASGLREEVKDLLANLEDDGFIVTFSYMGEDNGYIYIRKPLCDKREQFFNAKEVKGDIIRLCEFLGDRYLCDINITEAGGSMLRPKPVTMYQFEEREFKMVYSIKINLFSTSNDSRVEGDGLNT